MFFIKAGTRQHISHTPMRVFNCQIYTIPHSLHREILFCFSVFVILTAVLIMSGTFQP